MARRPHNIIKWKNLRMFMNTNFKTHSAAIGWVGILAVTAFIAMWLACYQADSSWTWGYNSLSDFGISYGTPAANYFNYGMVTVGALLAVYGIGRLQYNKKKGGYAAGGIFLAMAGFTILLIGLLTKDVQSADYHNFFAVLTAMFLALALIAITVQEYKDGMVLPLGVSIFVVVAIAAFALLFNFAKFEVYAIVAGLLWVAIDAAIMIATGIKEGRQ